MTYKCIRLLPVASSFHETADDQASDGDCTNSRPHWLRCLGQPTGADRALDQQIAESDARITARGLAPITSCSQSRACRRARPWRHYLLGHGRPLSPSERGRPAQPH